MNTKAIISSLFVFGISAIVFQSCNTENSKCGETNISQSGGDESHNNGLNCMNCHENGGEGEGCFTLAGSVYNEQLTNTLSNVTLRLYTEPQGAGELRFTLSGDAIGNFFTTDDISHIGLYSSLTGPSGNTQYMSTPLSSGACNSCHGVSTIKLWAN